MKCGKFMCKKQCEMRQINMQKNSAKCGKFMCKKQGEMRQIYVRKTVRNAANLCAKTRAKCGKFKCKKHCEMCHFSANFPYNFCIRIWRIFQCFLQESLQEIVWQFPIFFKLFHDDFLWDCVQGRERRDPGQIPV